jgi:hypothetical protein
MINILPINKIILASFAFALTHWKKIIEISIVPVVISLPFLSITPQLFEAVSQVYQGGELTEIILPENFTLYAVVFLYAYIMLSINMYRLVILGEQGVSAFLPIFNGVQILRFIGLSLLIGLATTLPPMLTGVGFLQFIAYFLIIPITLNFIKIAIQQPSTYKWQIGFAAQTNLFLLQIIIPILVGLVASLIVSEIGLPEIFIWVIKVVIFYWSLINLALCYQLIEANTSA